MPTHPPRSLPTVSKTALGVAAARARESTRPDHLFTDPYAQAFLDAAPGVLPYETKTDWDPARLGPAISAVAEAFYRGVFLRTRFFDDYLTAATAAGCRQVVLLAAGLDTRAFRLPWPTGTRVFELDLPEVLAFKQQVLDDHAAHPRCDRTVVVADLRENWPDLLTEAGFRPSVPTAWLAEGLLVYLARDHVTAMLADLGALCAPGSQLSFEHHPTGYAATRDRRPAALPEYRALWNDGIGSDAPDWLADHGWQVHIHGPAAVAASCGRSAPVDDEAGFLTARHLHPEIR